MKKFNNCANTQETSYIQLTVSSQEAVAQESVVTQKSAVNDAVRNAKSRSRIKIGHRIYIRSTKEWVEVDEEYYEIYMREVGTFRKKQYRDGLCMCSRNKEYMCDCDCLTCTYYRQDAFVSLDAAIADDKGNEETLMDQLVDEDSLTPEEATTKSCLEDAIGIAVEQLSDDEWLYYAFWDMEYSYSEIARAFCLKSKQLAAYRVGKILKRLGAMLEAWN